MNFEKEKKKKNIFQSLSSHPIQILAGFQERRCLQHPAFNNLSLQMQFPSKFSFLSLSIEPFKTECTL